MLHLSVFVCFIRCVTLWIFVSCCWVMNVHIAHVSFLCDFVSSMLHNSVLSIIGFSLISLPLHAWLLHKFNISIFLNLLCVLMINQIDWVVLITEKPWSHLESSFPIETKMFAFLKSLTFSLSPFGKQSSLSVNCNICFILLQQFGQRSSICMEVPGFQ